MNLWPARMIASLLTGAVTMRVQFAAQTAPTAVAQPRDGSVGGERRAGGQIFRERFNERIGDEKFSVAGVIGKFFQRQVERQFFVQPRQNFFVADEQILAIIGGGFGGEGFEGDFGANAGDVAKGNAEEIADCGLRTAD